MDSSNWSDLSDEEDAYSIETAHHLPLAAPGAHQSSNNMINIDGPSGSQLSIIVSLHLAL